MFQKLNCWNFVNFYQGRQKARQYKLDLIKQMLELKAAVPEAPNDLAPLLCKIIFVNLILG